MTDQLKPCPFCGSVRLETNGNSALEDLYLQCSDCTTTGPLCPNTTNLVFSWNDRPIEDDLQSRLTKAEAALDEAVKFTKSVSEIDLDDFIGDGFSSGYMFGLVATAGKVLTKIKSMKGK